MAVVDVPRNQPAAPSFAQVFPLPLTPFEAMMVIDSQPDYPMLADLQLHFEGRIERAPFEAGLAFAIARNPLFRCLIRHEGQGLPDWIPTDRLPRVDWAPLGTPIGEGYNQFIDLTQDIGLRLFVREGSDCSTVLMHFHHACSDGLGAYGFIEDFLAGYAAAVPGAAAVTPRPLEPARLKGRGLIGVTSRSLLRKLVDPFFGILEGIRFYAQAPLAMPPQVAPAVAAGNALFQSQTLTAEAVGGLRLAASRAGASFNDVLLRDLLLTLRRWQGAGSREPRWRRLRILMPQNLRESADYSMPSANAMSYAFITRKASRCDSPDDLLKSIRRETAAIRRGKLSLYFLGSITSLLGLGLLPGTLKRRTCFSTAVFSNLGDCTRRFVARFPRRAEGLVVGNLVFQGLTGGPPVRPLTRASFCAFNTASTLTVSLKCDPLSYAPLDVERLLGEYVAQLRATAALAGAGV